MTLLSDDVSVFGTIVPTVYIKNVILENSAAASDINNDRINAHTNPSATSLQNSLDIGSDPTVGGSAFVETAGNNDLKVTVDFLIKESLGNTFNEITSTWSNEVDLQNYTNIVLSFISNPFFEKIMQADPSLVFERTAEKIITAVYLLAKQDLLTTFDIGTCTIIGFKQSSFDKPFLDSNFGLDVDPAIMEQNFENSLTTAVVASQAVNLGDAMKNGNGINYGDIQALTQYAETDEDGKKVVNYQFTKVFEIQQDNIQYLSLIATPLLDIEGLGANFGLDLAFLSSDVTGGTPAGKVKVQKILQNGTLSSKSTVYYLQDDMSIWTGHVHRNSNSGVLMTGKTTTEDSRKIVTKIVNNNTVQDFRIIDRVALMKFDLSFLQTDSVALAEAYKYTRDKTDVLKQPAYFSRNYVSRGVDGSAKFLFGMDFYSFVREQTTFAAAYLPKEVDSINMSIARTSVKIANIKIKRKRVDVVPQSNRLGTYNAQEIPFKTGYLGEPHIDSEEIVRDVVIGKQANSFENKLVLNSSAPVGSSNTLEVTDFYLPEMGNLKHVGFEFFTARDFDVAKLTDGNYQYGLELEILDLSNTYITNKITSLIASYREMMGYYNLCSRPGTAYNTNSGRFRSILNDYYISINQQPWSAPISNLTNTIQAFRDESEVFDGELFQNQLELICHPTTGSPRGVEAVLKLILNAATKLAEIVGTELNFATVSQVASLINPDGTTNADFNKPIDHGTLFKTSPDKRTIKVEYYFDDSFDTEIPKSYGYDYLTATGDSATAQFAGQGLATVLGSNFNTRVNLETLKYFESTSPGDFQITNPNNGFLYNSNDTVLTSLFSYLTPASVNLGTGQTKGPITGETKAEAGFIDKTKFSLLPINNSMESVKYLFNKRAFSYIAAKIMNYNSNATLPIYDNVTTSDKTLLSGYENIIKFYTQQILANKNCVSVVEGHDPQINTDKKTTVGGLFLSNYLGNEIDEADNLIDNQITLNNLLNDPAISISYKGGAENSVFLTFIYGFSAQNYGIASATSPAPVVEGKQEVTFDFGFFQIGADTPNKPAIEATILSKKMAGQPSSIAPEGQAKIGVQNEIKKLPNQIKSILLQYNSKSQVKHKWNTQEDLDKNSNNPYYKASIAINYRNIKRVEYLAGFDYGKPPVVTGLGNIPSSMPLIGTQNWRTLTPQIYQANIDRTLFCRLKTYEDKDYGIVPMESLNMPVFDEFFLLKPATYVQNTVVLLEAPPRFDNSTTDGMRFQNPRGINTLRLETQDPAEYQDDSLPIRPLTRQEVQALRKSMSRI